MEPKYLAFRRWLYTPIIIWQGDWIPRVSISLAFERSKKAFEGRDPSRNGMNGYSKNDAERKNSHSMLKHYPPENKHGTWKCLLGKGKSSTRTIGFQNVTFRGVFGNFQFSGCLVCQWRHFLRILPSRWHKAALSAHRGLEIRSFPRLQKNRIHIPEN